MFTTVADALGDALLMAWAVWWALVLGFVLAGFVGQIGNGLLHSLFATGAPNR